MGYYTLAIASLSITCLHTTIAAQEPILSKGDTIETVQRSDRQDAQLDHSHAAFTEILQKHVRVIRKGVATQVDYASIKRQDLTDYLKPLLQVSKNTVDTWTKNQQLAFYFNLYNALTIDLILQNYPLESIKDLGSGFPLFQSPWKLKFFTLFGELSHLDRIEHELVRGNALIFDPLVHFAFNCASIGCPALAQEAYRSVDLESQLQQATRNFLRDRDRNYIKGGSAYVSSIFKWYEEDFTKGVRNFSSLKDFLAYYRNELTDNAEDLAKLARHEVDIEFLPYDWKLNGFK